MCTCVCVVLLEEIRRDCVNEKDLYYYEHINIVRHQSSVSLDNIVVWNLHFNSPHEANNKCHMFGLE